MRPCLRHPSLLAAVLAAALLAPASAVAATGQITTVAGTGTAGFDPSFGSDAPLNTPVSVDAVRDRRVS